MTESEKWQGLAQLIARHAPEDGRHSSAIDCLFFGRVSAPTEPMHFAQWASFALVAQGGKALHIGDEVLHYGPGDLLLVTLDMPLRSMTGNYLRQPLPLLTLCHCVLPSRYLC